MLQHNRARNKSSTNEYNEEPYQESSLIPHRMAQSNYMDTATTAQYMYENGHENSAIRGDNQFSVGRMDNDDGNMIADNTGETKRASPGFETFVMTGDMIIRTSTPDGGKKTSLQKKRKPTSQSHQAGADGDSNKHRGNDKGDTGSGIPKKKSSKLPQSKIPKGGTPAKDAGKDKKKVVVTSRIPKMASSSGGGSRDNSPKSSPKNSPKKVQSKLPQRQGGSVRSPVLSNRQLSSSSSAKVDSPPVQPLSPLMQLRQARESTNNNATVADRSSGAVDENNVRRQSGSTEVNRSACKVPKTPSLSSDADFSSFCVVPQAPSPAAYPELDIPPDDITSEDTAYQNMDAFVNLEDLPPPPDDLLHDDKSVSETDQVVPEAGGFLPIYSPSEITRQNHFTLDRETLQATDQQEIAPPPPMPDSPPPVFDTKLPLAQNRYESPEPPVEAPLSPEIFSAQDSDENPEPFVVIEHSDLVEAAPPLPPPPVDNSHVMADHSHMTEDHSYVTADHSHVTADHSHVTADHSYSMLPEDSDSHGLSYEENLLNSLEHGVENDLDTQGSDTLSSEALDDFNHVPTPCNTEELSKQPVSSRIPVMKHNDNSVSGVRNSKSHENYLESSNVDPSLQCVDIDFEEDHATSVDVLHYQDQSTALSAERQSKSLDNSPEKGSDKHSEKILMPTFINIEEPRSIGKLKEGGRLKDITEIRQSVGEPKVGFHMAKSPKDRDAEVNGASYNSRVIMFDTIGESSTDTGEAGGSVQKKRKSKKEPMMEKCSDGVWLSIGAMKEALSAQSTPQHSAHSDGSPAKHKAEINYSGASNDVFESGACAGGSQPTALRDTTDGSPRRAQQQQQQHTTHSSPSHLQQGPEVEQQQPQQQQQYSPRHAPPPAYDTCVGSDEGITSSEDKLLGGAGPNQGGACCAPDMNDSDTESLYHQPIKDVDRPSAHRLAKRLFNLEGFKKSDISKHLSKKNEFSQLVGEEYLKYFDFSGMTLDAALRDFLKHLTVSGETQERERVLAHFSHRFVQVNPGTFNSDDACHTLTCALMLLNTDHHGQNIGRKMTLAEFIENLSELNDGENFPKEVLRQLYLSIKEEKLECEFNTDVNEMALVAGAGEHVFIGANPFLDVPDPGKAVEYKKGYVMRKCCSDPDGRKTPMGKRGWKMFYAVLRDMVLYLHKNEKERKSTVYNNINNAIRIHHALATKATNYTKKAHVFRLQTSDWAEYLFETSDVKECQAWMDTINLVAASLSAPPLPGAVGSQRKFQRPLMPSSYTRLNLSEQMGHHEQRVGILEKDLHEHRLYPPEKGAKSRVIQDYTDKEQYLQFELKRFKTYSFLLQSKIAAFPELEPSLVEIAIGEVDEPSSPPSPEEGAGGAGTSGARDQHSPPIGAPESDDVSGDEAKSKSKQQKSQQRSVVDRYSYRAAIYKQDAS